MIEKCQTKEEEFKKELEKMKSLLTTERERAYYKKHQDDDSYLEYEVFYLIFNNIL